MTDLVGELETVLSAELEELRQLVSILEEEAQALRRVDVPAVMSLTERKAGIARRVKALEARRQSLAASLAARLDVSPDSLTVSRLEVLVPASRPRLAPLRQEFRDLVEQLLGLNSRNAFLIEQSLASLQHLLTDLLAALAPNPTYAADGRPDASASALQLLDRRA